MKKFVVCLWLMMTVFAATSATLAKEACCKTENVILITLDGVRWQEVFTGVDKRFFDQGEYLAYGKTHEDFKSTFWREQIKDRREVLFPFLWNVIGSKGQLYGNRVLGSRANLGNDLYFSYPGYSEILTGFADPRIKSNDKIPNPNWTFLEWLGQRKGFEGKSAAFGSWDVFPYIINEDRSGIYANAGFEPVDIMPGNKRVAELNQLQKDIPSPWDTVRLDAFTFNFALEYLKEKQPRALYIALGETDDFAHSGHYDQYIYAAQRNDAFIARIWNWVQSDPHYRGKTTLLITTDHGRGYADLALWKSHGHKMVKDSDGSKKRQKVESSDEVWMAVIGPDTPAHGEMKSADDVTSSQIAATLVKMLGHDYKSSHETLKAGEPVAAMIE